MDQEKQDEPHLEADTGRNDADTGLEEQLAKLDLGTSCNTNTETENISSQSNTQSSKTGGMTRVQCGGAIRPKPKCFLLPATSQPQAKKINPVARYFHYRTIWDKAESASKRARRALGPEIRKRLVYQPPPRTDQRSEKHSSGSLSNSGAMVQAIPARQQLEDQEDRHAAVPAPSDISSSLDISVARPEMD